MAVTTTTDERTERLAVAARKRHDETRRKAVEAIRSLDAAGASVSFAAVARVAGISRAWLYNNDTVRAEIVELRDRTTGSTSARPVVERASDRSLHQLVTALRTREAELRRENQLLREALARKFGEERVAQLTAPSAVVDMST